VFIYLEPVQRSEDGCDMTTISRAAVGVDLTAPEMYRQASL